ncbi:MAG: glycosyltransferase family 4 protein [Bacteroidaceae bacterium]|nr:glycosyltransferase family 4 protein [Bacteroidaceae bacterium]
MRVLIINTSERVGGAAIAANRLMKALKKNGVKVKMLVRDKQTDHLTVFSVGHNWTQPIKFVWERLCIFMANNFNRKNLFQVDIANTGTDITQHTEFQRADIIHLHWVNQGFLSLANINKILHAGKPVVITMHDQWYFTGICHYSGNCQKYQELCHHCELIKGNLLGDLAKQVFLKKEKIYSDAQLTFVGCSQWMANLAKTSKLTQGHRVVSIPNAIDTDLFCPQDKKQARLAFKLPTDKRLLLFGCQRITDERKGFHYLVEALQLLKQQQPNLAKGTEIVVVGGEADSIRHKVPFNIFPIRYVSDPQKMVQLYNAVDLYVTPSLQDNLPNTIMESMACGTPCVGFNVGGIPEMIDHKENGYVATYKDAQDFANGILWILAADQGVLSRQARNKVMTTYSEDAVAFKYKDVYNS